jgi:hypothetical protein
MSPTVSSRAALGVPRSLFRRPKLSQQQWGEEFLSFFRTNLEQSVEIAPVEGDLSEEFDGATSAEAIKFRV